MNLKMAILIYLQRKGLVATSAVYLARNLYVDPRLIVSRSRCSLLILANQSYYRPIQLSILSQIGQISNRLNPFLLNLVSVNLSEYCGQDTKPSTSFGD